MNTPHEIRQWLADNRHLRHEPDAPNDPIYDVKLKQLEQLEWASGLRVHIKHKGQSRVDAPVYSTTHARPLAYGIAAAFGREIRQTVQVFDGYDSTTLRWMKPDGKGGLEPVDE